MGLEFLARVRRTTYWIAAVAALLAASYAGPLHGLAMALGALWSLGNLRLLQELVVALTGPARSAPAERRRALLAITGLMMLFGIGAVMLATLPPATLLWGFLVPIAVIVLKAVSVLLLGSRAWRAIVASPWRAAFAVLALAAVAWLATGGWSRAVAGDGAAVVTAQEHAAAHGEAAAHGGAHSGEPEKFANVITILVRAFPEAGWAHLLHSFEPVLFAFLVAALLCLIAYLATRRVEMIPGPLQNAVEWVIEVLYDFIVEILGPKHGPRYVPFLGTLFVYILAMNVFGLIPFMDSPTSNLNVTFALAFTVFVYAQWIGFRELGVIGYIDHMAGNPRTVVSWFLVPLMLPIHVLGELAKPISLSCRLFGNIFGEDMLLVAFATLGISMLGFTGLPFGLPLQLPFLFLALLTSTLQALVFAVLAVVYFLLMLPHDEHAHEPGMEAEAVPPNL